MAADVSKQLERAKKFLEKNRVEDAIEAYLGVLDGSPQHLELRRRLATLHAAGATRPRRRLLRPPVRPPDRPQGRTKALAIYNRFTPQYAGDSIPGTHHPLRLSAAKAEIAAKRPSSNTQSGGDVLRKPGAGKTRYSAGKRTAQLDPEKLSRQMKVAEIAAQLGKKTRWLPGRFCVPRSFRALLARRPTP